MKLEFGATGFQPIYKLTYVEAMSDDETPVAVPEESIIATNVGMITYTLSVGTTFNERVSPNDFEITGDDDADLEVMSGGTKGASSVTIKVTAGAAWTGANSITFTIPDLSAMPGRSGAAQTVNPVRMSSSYSLSAQSNFPEGDPQNGNCEGAATPAVLGCRIVTAQKYVDSFTLGDAATGNIDLNDRTKLISGETHLDDIAIGTVAVAAASGTAVKDQDGNAVSFSGDLSGDVAITVRSAAFRVGDIVYIDDDDDKGPGDSRERFTIAGDMATADRALPTPAEGTPMASWTIRYKPNGKDELEHDTSMTVSAMTDFSNRDNANATARMGTAASIMSTLRLNGIRPNPPKAYAIAPISSSDVANLRITCENAKACNVFLSCRDSMGTDYFGDEGFMVPANGTARMNQMELGAALGMMEGEGWSGRLACKVLSTAAISVQVLTRAAGVLVNNTYVGEGGMADAM